MVAALEAEGLAVGLGRAPVPAPDSHMYVVVYVAPGQSISESLADRRTDFQTVVQVTCVAPDEERCLWLADKVRTALWGPLTVAGRVAYRAEDEGGPPVQRDDDVTPPLYYTPIQFTVRSTS
ncbi:hypothetical protein [Streptomyces sp. NPDC126499]|uniref:hypothetical protein n=1 Tax=Streptomyces sp. NPDC126499 TaxID=3155314 RepID=UPI003322E83A